LAGEAWRTTGTRIRGEALPRLPCVLPHLGYERIDRREARLLAQKCNEDDIDRMAVEFGVEIEHMDLEQRRTVVELRPAAETRHPGVLDASENHLNSVSLLPLNSALMNEPVRIRPGSTVSTLTPVPFSSLARPSNETQRAFVGNQTGGRVAFFLSTDDFWRDYESMLAAGVEFVRPPSEAPYGVVAVFRDLYGNLWDLIQPAA
jgi:hypothetical protein